MQLRDGVLCILLHQHIFEIEIDSWANRKVRLPLLDTQYKLQDDSHELWGSKDAEIDPLLGFLCAEACLYEIYSLLRGEIENWETQPLAGDCADGTLSVGIGATRRPCSHQMAKRRTAAVYIE